jgi:hypothetical protein
LRTMIPVYHSFEHIPALPPAICANCDRRKSPRFAS